MDMNQPRVVKFSGGRSSGMMLMQMLEQNALTPERGDVIVFNNTSAEHPATYDFAREMKNLAEKKHNIPFFWVEYQTYEIAGKIAGKHVWKRNHSYRLVNEHPHSSDNPQGYRYKGEVYEEMISLKGFLPNMQDRICTQTLKIFVTNSFLTDWFAQKDGIERLGHFSDAPRMISEDVVHLHKHSRGSTPADILLGKRDFVMNRPFVREECLWENFVHSSFCFNNDTLKQSITDNKGQLFGDKAIAFVSCLGIRKDEEARVEKIRARISHANGRGTLFSQPPKEEIMTPLVDSGVSQQDVIDFWKEQSFNLELPDSGIFSNCVYCPLKGKRKLLQLAMAERSNGTRTELTPASIDWWVAMERKYSRNLNAEERNITSKKDVNFIGFFGATQQHVFQQIKEQASVGGNGAVSSVNAEFLEDENYIPCNCTD